MANEKRLIDANTKIIDKYFNKRLIYLDEALKATHSEIYWTESQQAAVRSFLVRQPKVDAVEVVHGMWEDNHCTVCGMMPMGEELWEHLVDHDPPRMEYFMDYCPNCGAKMDGDGE